MDLRRRLSGAYAGLIRRLTRPVLRRIDATVAADYSQTEALVGLYATLGIRRPLPPLRRATISPDAACELVGLILDRRPATIVELGSGASTLIAGYALERTGCGRLVSLEHDRGWFERSSALVRAHGLEDVAQVVHAPLRTYALAGETWPWYDLRAVADLGVVDLLIVDGPPGHLCAHARYPAVPLLREHLSPTAAIVVDDADRPHEAAIVRRWAHELGACRMEHVRTEKGLCVLRRDGADGQSRSDES